MIERCIQDLRAGARILRQAPGLSAAAILLIALVIGGNTTVYSMVNGILVSPAAGVNAERLVVIRHVDPSVRIADPFVSFPNFEDYARHSTTVTDFAAWNGRRLTMGTPTGNYAAFGGLVTTNYFDTFAVNLVHGRRFVARDDEGRDGLAVLISHRVWVDRFNQADDVIGRSISVNRVAATIVGVTEPGFAGATLTPGEDLWVPIRAYSRLTGGEDELMNRTQPLVLMAARRGVGVSLREARSEFATLSAQLHQNHPDAFTTYSPRGVVPLQNPRALVSPYSASALLPIADLAPVFLAVFSIVTLLTLIVVCANVANLLLGRSVERQRDIAVRRSLGASRARIVRTLLAEGATLAVAAWVASYLVAAWTSPALLRLIEPRPGLLADLRPDWTRAAYGIALAALATAACSIAPVLRASRMPVLPFLKAGEQGIARGRSRLATSLVVVQFAFSVLLVTSAGLAYRSMTSLSSSSLGFNPDNLLLVTVRLNSSSSDGGTPAIDAGSRAVLERARERLSVTEGVDAVSYARRIPGATLLTTTRVRRDDQRAAAAFVRHVGPDYLQALALAPISGREFAGSDRTGSGRAAMINQGLAMELFGDQVPLGHSLSIGDGGDRVEIVGVVPDALFDGPSRDPHPRYLFVAEQQTSAAGLGDPSFVIRYRGAVDAIAPVVGRALADVDADLPIVAMSTMSARLALVTEFETMIVQLLACFAVLSLVIAALGHYAVAAFNIRRRTREFGVRMALGASTQRIQVAVVRETLAHTALGLAIGLALSTALAVSFRSLLFGVTPVDPATIVGVSALLVVISVVASHRPARRASRISVVEALRDE